MLRGYGRIVAAIAGLILSCQHESSKANAAQSSANSEISQKLDRIDTAVKKLPERPEPDRGCPKGQDNRESDLCAQWKAADAASDAAWWAMVTLWAGCIGVVIGAGTLFAAGYAAWYAKRAAEETKRSADVASDAHAVQINSERPLLMALQDIFELWAIPHESGFNDGHTPPFTVPVERFLLRFRVKNFGQTPCWIEAVWFGFHVSKGGREEIDPDRAIQFRDATVGFVAPLESLQVGGSHYQLTAENIARVNSTGGGMLIVGALQYRAPAGHIFNTGFAFHVNVGDHPTSAAPISEKRFWRDGRIKAPKMWIDDPIEYIGSEGLLRDI